MKLENIKKIKGNSTKAKRVGRGVGSGKGAHTTGSGMKGQNSRSGNSKPVGFEGGQVPIYKKLPKLPGFRNPNSKKITQVSLFKLNAFEDGSTVTPKDLIEKNIISKLPKHGVKILLKGDLNKKLTLQGFLYSAGAKQAIEKSGSTIKENA